MLKNKELLTILLHWQKMNVIANIEKNNPPTTVRILPNENDPNITKLQ